LKNELRFSTEHMRWRARSQTLLFQVFGPQSIYHTSFCALSWSYVGYVEAYPAAVAAAHQETYLKHLDAARGILLAAQDELERSDLEMVYRGKDSAPEASLILKVIGLAEHKLRKTLREQPERERQVQDAFENLLIGAEIPYAREVGGIEYSSKTYVPDFTISTADLVVEMKLCNKIGREKELIAEINDDIVAYRTKYGNLLFVVYDLGQIRDVERFTASFEAQKALVRVVKH
jgi:hypothetical protein